jgi:hypothetical protein
LLSIVDLTASSQLVVSDVVEADIIHEDAPKRFNRLRWLALGIRL